MKRLRSSDDVDSYEDKSVTKDWGRRDEDVSLHRSSSSYRSSYYRSSESGRKGSSSSSTRYDRAEDDRESSRLVRKRSDYDLDSYDRSKSYDRHRDGNERGILSSSPRAGYGVDRMYRAENFLGPRRDFPKGFRSERERSRREGSVSSWRRFGGGKESDDGTRSDGSEMVRASRVEPEHFAKAKSPQGMTDAKSPAWSKDSGSQQSKSVEIKKCEDFPVDCSGRSSDKEEGELEPDPQPVSSTNPVDMDMAAVKLKSSQEELNSECHVKGKVLKETTYFLSVEQEDASKVHGCKEPMEGVLSKVSQDVMTKAKELSYHQDTSIQGTSGSGDENEINVDHGNGNNEEEARGEVQCEDIDAACAVKSSTSQEEQKEHMDIDLEVQADDTDMAENEGFREESEMPMIELTVQNVKDKGKSVAVLPTYYPHFTQGLEVENKSKDLKTFGNAESTRGFEFFSTNPVKKLEKVEPSSHNKPKDEKLALELSLSLPNILLPMGAQNREPGSPPSHARSAQSFPSTFQADSDGFTMSMSFSGSQQFTHNPSCSLTHDAFDYEQSVKSRPIFQGLDWKALSSDENNDKEVPVYQGMVLKGNSLHQQSEASHGNSNDQAVSQNLRVVGGSSKLPIRLEKQLSFKKHLSGAHSLEKQLSLEKHLSGAHSSGSHDNGREYCEERRPIIKEKDSGSLHRIIDGEGKKQVLEVGVDFAESIITMIVSEPLESMTQRFNDMAEKYTACVKEFVHDIMTNPGKRWQLSALQKALRNRSEIKLDMLVKLHRAQLEILVALKTGREEFLQQNYGAPSSDLAEIFLNMRCRNLTCRSLLPVDECDCKICVQKNGFCRECMCLVCSKFDMASNTCSWVGCDVCLHWCHADCGLRESHIRNGRSASGAQGTTEMQFHCVACDHLSEMYGFVKEVFQNFVKEWTAENLSRELEYVRRIFFASKDARGKQLHEIAIRMLSKLANKADLQEVQNHIMGFFTETVSLKPGNEPGNELLTRNQEGNNGIAGSSRGPMWLESIRLDKAPHLENSLGSLPIFDCNRNDKYTTNFDLQTEARKENGFDELEGIVRVKQAEAKMFQGRADDATREAEALKRVAVKKSERIDEEYSSRIRKLRLAEAEEMHKQKVEELQALERAYQEYFNMKMRMESDINGLLLKMEATR